MKLSALKLSAMKFKCKNLFRRRWCGAAAGSAAVAAAALFAAAVAVGRMEGSSAAMRGSSAAM